MNTLEVEITMLKCLEFNKNIIVNNIVGTYGLLKFETDMLVLSKSGYAHGFEIKVSKSDLKNDLKKKQWIYASKDEKAAIRLYFEKLKYFSYCVPSELKEDIVQQVPHFCGIYICEKNYYFDYELGERKEEYYYTLRCIRKPKLLNKYKFTEKEIIKIAHLGCMRIFNLKQNILKNL